MISPILSLALTILHAHNFYLEDRDWEGSTHSATNSIEVTGSQTYYEPAVPQGEYVASSEGTHNTNPIAEGAIASGINALLSNTPPQNELVTIHDVARLNINGGTISIQPSRGWAYVNKPVYLQSNTQPVTKETTLLGNTVTITATPVSYTWNCGDGHTFTTKDAGGTWEQGSTVTHSYTRAGTYTLSAEIVWQASYNIGGQRYPIKGTLTTTSTTQQINIREAEAVLTN